MAATPSIKLVMSCPFKGGARVWSNRYHFNGGTPADAAHWLTLANAITASFKTTVTSKTTITGAIGYAAASDVPVFTHTYALAGTYSAAGTDQNTPLENAALIRWSTAARTTKNHPIYCFSYIHDAMANSSHTWQETLSPTQAAALATYATAWITGFSDGSITAVRATPNGAAATGSIVEEYITHRDFPYTSSV